MVVLLRPTPRASSCPRSPLPSVSDASLNPAKQHSPPPLSPTCVSGTCILGCKKVNPSESVLPSSLQPLRKHTHELTSNQPLTCFFGHCMSASTLHLALSLDIGMSVQTSCTSWVRQCMPGWTPLRPHRHQAKNLTSYEFFKSVQMRKLTIPKPPDKTLTQPNSALTTNPGPKMNVNLEILLNYVLNYMPQAPTAHLSPVLTKSHAKLDALTKPSQSATSALT